MLAYSPPPTLPRRTLFSLSCLTLALSTAISSASAADVPNLQNPLALDRTQVLGTTTDGQARQRTQAQFQEEDKTAQVHARKDTRQTPQTLQTVTVKAKGTAPSPSVSGPMPLTLRETPQSVSITTQEQMRDQGLVSAQDVLKHTTGTSFGFPHGSFGLAVNARGYSLNTVLIDGLSLGNERRLSTDLALYEQVEVMRGPAGLYVGSGASGSPGGAINLVRKKPTQQRRASVLASAASWDNYRVMVDASGALNTSGSLRGRGIVSKGDRKFFHDFAYDKTLTVGSHVELDITPATMLTLGLDYQTRNFRPAHHMRFRGWDGKDLGGARSRSIGMPWGKARTHEYGAFIMLDHQFANQWGLRAHYTRKHSDSFDDFANLYWRINPGTGQLEHFIEGTFAKSKYRDEALSVNLNGSFDAWGRAHDFVTGFNLQSNRRDSLNMPSNLRGYGATGGHSKLEVVDFPNMDYSQYPYLPSAPDWSRWDYYEPTRQIGYYANVRFNVSDPLNIMAGARVGRFSDGGVSRYYTSTPQYKHGAYRQSAEVTPFAALSYDIGQQHTTHISYSENFKIQDYYDIEGNRLPALKGKNWETGLKSEWNDGQLYTMLTFYRLERVNGALQVENSPCLPLLNIRGINAACYVSEYRQRTSGMEFEINGSLSPTWDIVAGGSAMKHKYSEDPGQGKSRLWGSWMNVRAQPTRTLHAWLLHRLQGPAEGWRIGLGMHAQNRTFADYAETVTRDTSGNVLSIRPGFRDGQGSVTTFNAMVSWDITPQWRAQLNMDNLTSRNYDPTMAVPPGAGWYVGNTAPRSWTLTLTGQF